MRKRPNRLYRCHHFQENLRNFITAQCLHVSLSIFDIRNKEDGNTPITVLCRFMQISQV